jgi:hypothetical protein
MKLYFIHSVFNTKRYAMQRLIFSLVLLFHTMAFSQISDVVPVHNYAVPLPATSGVSYVQWHYQMELAFEDGQPGDVTIFQYDRRGRLYGSATTLTLGEKQVYLWDSKADLQNPRVRSVLVQANRPLVGTVVAEHLGQLMANRLVASESSTVAIPFLPELNDPNLYEQLTLSLSVFGADASVNASDLDFALIDNRGFEQATQRLRDDLASNGVVPVTPYFSLVLDGLESQVTPAWAQITATNPNYHLTAIQAFALSLDSEQMLESAASLESQSDPVTHGQLIFSELNLSDEAWVVVTNPHAFDVDVNFDLAYLPVFTEEELKFLEQLDQKDPITFKASEGITLRPLERRLLVMGSDLFADVVGEWHRLSFATQAAFASEDLTEPPTAAVYAASFFNDGANSFTAAQFAQAGNTVDLWIRLDATQDQLIELATIGEQFWVPNHISAEAVEPVLEFQDPSQMFVTSVPNGDLVSETSAVSIEIFAGNKLINRSETVLKPGEVFTGIQTATIRELFGQSEFEVFRIRVTSYDGALLTASESRLGEMDRAAVTPRITIEEIPENIIDGDTVEAEPTKVMFKN